MQTTPQHRQHVNTLPQQFVWLTAHSAQLWLADPDRSVIMRRGARIHAFAAASAAPPPLKVVTKGKAKAPPVLQSGAILELGNFCCEFDNDVPLEEFK